MNDGDSMRSRIEKYKKPAYALALYLVSDPDAAYECAASAFVSALAGGRKQEDDFQVSLFSALVADCRFRRVVPRPNGALQRFTGQKRAQLELMEKAVRALDFEAKTYVLLRDQLRLAYPVIAGIMRVSVGEAKRLTFLARGALREKITGVLEHG